jgi:biopolymer transport protein ExbD
MNLRTRRRPVPQIPIVSLIDIMVVLLIFFMFNTTFRTQTTRMQIALPESKSMGSSTQVQDVRVTLAITKQNETFLDGKAAPLDTLATALKRFKAAQPSARLELEADTESDLGTLVQVWDALKAAGIPITDVPARIQRK